MKPTHLVADPETKQWCEWASYILAAVALLLVMVLRLLPAFLAGLLVYEIVRVLRSRLHIADLTRTPAKAAAIALLAGAVIVALIGIAVAAVAFIRSEAGSMPALLQRMADIMDSWRTTLPAWVVERLPTDVDDIKTTSVQWLRDHASELQHAGEAAGRALAHIVIGMGIGGLVAVRDAQPDHSMGPLARALGERTSRIGEAFRRVVFSQIRISAINTALTGLYLLVILPLAGAHIPLAKTMVVVVFFLGLIPVVGNLISNTIIAVLSLSVSLSVAIASLVFLVIIHKLEYFLNAHIVGSRVQAHAWELLLAMLVMEAAFGAPGLIAAPIYYAYLKDELMSRSLV